MDFQTNQYQKITKPPSTNLMCSILALFSFYLLHFLKNPIIKNPKIIITQISKIVKILKLPNSPKTAISNFILNFCTLTGHFPPIWAKFYRNFHQILPNFFCTNHLKCPVKVQKPHLNTKKINLSAKIRKARLDVFLIFPKEKLKKRTVQRGHNPL